MFILYLLLTHIEADVDITLLSVSPDLEFVPVRASVVGLGVDSF